MGSPTKRVVEPVGAFEGFGQVERGNLLPNAVFHYLAYEKQGVRIKYVFYGDKIHGMKIDYVDKKEVLTDEEN